MKLHLSVLVLSCALSACAFFEEPVEDLGSVLASAPDDAVPAAAPLPSNTQPPPLPAAGGQTAATPNRTSAASAGTFLTVVTIFDIPDSARNLSVVHFTDRNPRREQAICRALVEKFPPVAPADVPANTSNLIVWPVSALTGSSCRDMVASYEPIDISNRAAERVNSESTGPFLLSRNTSSDRRLIYDLSSLSNRALANGIVDWQAIVSTPPASWPPYTSAR